MPNIPHFRLNLDADIAYTQIHCTLPVLLTFARLALCRTDEVQKEAFLTATLLCLVCYNMLHIDLYNLMTDFSETY